MGQLESKASALACRSKAEALDSSGPAPRLAGTMTKVCDLSIRLEECVVVGVTPLPLS